MQLSKTGKLAIFYRWSYGKSTDQLPNNLCPYFWKLVLAFFLLPITWVSFIWGFKIQMDYDWKNDRFIIDKDFAHYFNYNKPDFMLVKRFFTGISIYGLLTEIVFVISLLLNMEISFWDFIVKISAFTGIGIIGSMILILLYFLSKAIIRTHQRVITSSTYKETKHILEETYVSVKENYCPKINWSE